MYSYEKVQIDNFYMFGCTGLTCAGTATSIVGTPMQYCAVRCIDFPRISTYMFNTRLWQSTRSLARNTTIVNTSQSCNNEKSGKQIRNALKIKINNEIFIAVVYFNIKAYKRIYIILHYICIWIGACPGMYV